MIGRGLDLVAAHGTRILAVAVLAGLAIPALSMFLRPLLTPAVWFLMFLAMLRIDWSAVIGYARRPLLMVTVVAWFILVSPVLTWLVVDATGLAPPLAAGVILMAATAPLMGSPAFCMLLGLDVSLSLVTMVVAHLAMPFTLPLIAIEVMRLEISIDLIDFMGRLVAIIGSAVVAAVIARKAIGTERIEERGRDIEGLAVLTLMVFAISVMDGVLAAILADPRHLAWMVAVAVLANLALQVAGAGGFSWAGRGRALTVGFSTGNRNMGILLAVLPEATAGDTLIFFAVAQIPMYTLPAMLAPIYRGILGTASDRLHPPASG
jgi:bile acid:Na+ symporter, BASS family